MTGGTTVVAGRATTFDVSFGRCGGGAARASFVVVVGFFFIVGFFYFVPALVGFFCFVPALFFPLEFAIFVAFGSFLTEYTVFVSAARCASMSACLATCAPDGLVMLQWFSLPSSSGKITANAEAKGAHFGLKIPIAPRPKHTPLRYDRTLK